MTTKRKNPAPKTQQHDLETHFGTGTDYDGDEVNVVQSASGAAYFLPASLPVSVRRLRPAQADAVSELQKATMKREELMQRIDHLVGDLREEGVSWGVIGWSVGTTSEAARQRWGVGPLGL